MRRILKLGAALDDGMLLALLSLYVFKCNEVSVLYTAVHCMPTPVSPTAHATHRALERYTSITS